MHCQCWVRVVAHVIRLIRLVLQDQVRRFLGVCPQHDILFDQLTVREHLAFYGMAVMIMRLLVASLRICLPVTEHSRLDDLVARTRTNWSFCFCNAGTLKGSSEMELEASVRSMLVEVGLQDKEHAAAGTLSGGQKRKLSVAIALIGGSKLIFLDEVFALVWCDNRRFTLLSPVYAAANKWR